MCVHFICSRIIAPCRIIIMHNNVAFAAESDWDWNCDCDCDCVFSARKSDVSVLIFFLLNFAMFYPQRAVLLLRPFSGVHSPSFPDFPGFPPTFPPDISHAAVCVNIWDACGARHVALFMNFSPWWQTKWQQQSTRATAAALRSSIKYENLSIILCNMRRLLN